MLQKAKLAVGQLSHNRTARLLLILGIMVLATLIAGAPGTGGCC